MEGSSIHTVVPGVYFIQQGLFCFCFVSGLDVLKSWPRKSTFLSEDSHLVVKSMLVLKHLKIVPYCNFSKECLVSFVA